MNCTSIEQSKKLLELGLSPETADMCWQSNLDNTDREYLLGIGEEEYWDIEMIDGYNDIRQYDYPAWSVEALLKLIGSCDIHFSALTGDFISINCLDNEISGTSLLDICYEMVLWQLEEGYIKKGE